MNMEAFSCCTKFKPFLWIVLVALVATTRTTALHVQDFGAFPNDDLDDTQAIQRALEAIEPTGDVLEFSHGEYLVSGQEEQDDEDEQGMYRPMFHVHDVRNLHIQGNGALLNGVENWATMWFINKVTNFKMSNLQMDWEYDLPFTAGQVVGEGDIRIDGEDYGYIDIQVVAPHTVRSGWTARAFLEYDPVRQRPAVDGYDIYNSKRAPPCIVRDKDEGIMRCYKGNPDRDTPVGTHVVVRWQLYDYNVLGMHESVNVTFENIDIYASISGGITVWNVENIHMSHVSMKPKNNRWLATNSDGFHLINVRGNVTVEHSHFEALGDDAINSHNHYFRVAPGTPAAGTNLKMRLAKKNDDIPIQAWPRVGDVLQFSRSYGPDPYQGLFEVSIQNVVGYVDPDETLLVVVDPPIPPGLFDLDEDDEYDEDDENMILVLDLSNVPSRTVVRHSTFKGIRARGMLLNNRRVTVERCLFQDITGPAIKMSTEDKFFEGVPARDVWIHDNKFQHNNYGAAQKGGTITSYVRRNGEQAERSLLYYNLTIESNDFVLDDGELALWLAAANDVTVRNNTFRYGGQPNVFGGGTNSNTDKAPNVYVHPSCGKDLFFDVPSVKGASIGTIYSEDFGTGSWEYLWNRNGPVGKATSYVPLKWNEDRERYDHTELEFAFLSDSNGHPGPGRRQDDALSRFVIAAWTVPVNDKYAIDESFFEATNNDCGSGNELAIYVNDELIIHENVNNGKVIDFDVNLGMLKAGDKIYVAVGPRGDDKCDLFTWDFDIAVLESIQPATLQSCPDTSREIITFITRSRRRWGKPKRVRRTIRCRWLNQGSRAKKICSRPLAGSRGNPRRVRNVCQHECGVCTP